MKKKLFDMHIVYCILLIIAFTSCEKDGESEKQFIISEEDLIAIFFEVSGGEKYIDINTNVEKN